MVLLAGEAATQDGPERDQPNVPMRVAQNDQPDQDDLRGRFLRARERLRKENSGKTASPAPTPNPAAKPARKPESPSREPTPKRETREMPAPSVASQPKQTPSSSEPPRRERRTTESARAPEEVKAARGSDQSGSALSRAPIHVEKLGEAEDEEPEPLPSPEKRRGWWIFGRREPKGESYKFLTPALQRKISEPKIRRGRWKYIVVHNSGSRNGNAKIFDYYHRRVRKMRNGMAYHFVIGNGSASPDGRIEIGERWSRQINGGHVASDYLNDIGIGICLVGDFNNDLPTTNQLGALKELTDYLRKIAGNKRRKTPVVRGHRDINPKPTDCPGDRWYRTGWLQRTLYN